MSDWRTLPLEDALDRLIDYRGKSPPKSLSGIPVISAKVVKAGRITAPIEQKIAPSFYPQWMTRGFPKAGDVVLTTEGPLGEVAQLDNQTAKFALGQRVVCLQPKHGVLDGTFLKFLLMSPAQQSRLSGFATGTTVAGISQKALRSVPITIPPFADQVMIGKVAGALDDKIELNRRMNETLETMARAIFQDWFVAFGPTRAKMEGRPPYLAPDIWALFPDRLDAEVKPEGWTLGTLDDVISILETGGRPRGGVSGYREGVPSIGAESIVGLGVYDYSKTKFVPRGFFDGMTKGRVESRDVLLYKDGGRPGEFEPHATLVGDGFPFEECAINEHVYRIRAMPAFGQTLLFFALTSEELMAEMRLKGTGVAIPGLNSTQARSLTMLMPSQAVADAFNATTEPLIRRILANCNESRTLAQTRDLLLPRLMSGELRVKDAERAVEAAT